MVVVSDTTPLRHLFVIGRIELLPALYRRVTIPFEVWRELQADASPPALAAWLGTRPNWLDVRSPSGGAATGPASERLDLGERQAIQLAIEMHADVLLIDDRDGRAVAIELGLPVVGTLGVLERASLLGLLPDLPSALARLEDSGFYLSARLRDAVLERHRQRRG
ncbi:MAG: DUF3368 domain-containing protein [Bryobacteraceae bacterium]